MADMTTDRTRLCEVIDTVIDLKARLALALAVVEAARAGPCRHTADHTGDSCGLCKALAAFDGGRQP